MFKVYFKVQEKNLSSAQDSSSTQEKRSFYNLDSRSTISLMIEITCISKNLVHVITQLIFFLVCDLIFVLFKGHHKLSLEGVFGK